MIRYVALGSSGVPLIVTPLTGFGAPAHGWPRIDAATDVLHV